MPKQHEKQKKPVDAHRNETQQDVRRTSGAVRYGAALVLTVCAAFVVFVLWGCLAYRFRLSAAVIRAGLAAGYALYGLIGGLLLRRLGMGLLYALLLGLCLCGLLYAGACLYYGFFVPTEEIGRVCFLCAAGAVIGNIRKR